MYKTRVRAYRTYLILVYLTLLAFVLFEIEGNAVDAVAARSGVKEEIINYYSPLVSWGIVSLALEDVPAIST